MKRITLCILVLVLSLGVFAQGNVEKQMISSEYYRATDANGRTLTLKEKPKSVMVAGKAAVMPANALFLFPEVQQMDVTLSKTDQGLGDFFSSLRPSLDEQPRLDQQASVEEIAATNPDLVLIKTANYESVGKKLDQLGVPNFTMNLETYDEWKVELAELGKLLKNTFRATQILDIYERRLSAITKKVAAIPESQKKRVLFLQGVSENNANSFKIAPEAWMQTWMVEQVGAIAVWKGANLAANGWSTVSFEQIAAWDPEVIYVVSYKSLSDPFVEAIYSSPIWKSLDAVKNNQVKSTPADMLSYMQPVSSWILGAEWMAKDLYPQLFADVDMDEMVRTFYTQMYSITDTTKLDTIVSKFNASLALNNR
ncbi:ABC transporter substrate-binding protein [Sphaerochaeta sp. PS]|uniref:ABC transporter substrate-binding protein n=1 Tax=Sphaerochaeta sp. PS TaxID=3076336 RepID=UPI0028A45DBB|nr:ABC transporter substrate-binding protein [Sphaerochaeta sp. PS]MDT4763099.1 ABC transporter substrate-binding protein [Sphaerochaeta sp. PS]